MGITTCPICESDLIVVRSTTTQFQGLEVAGAMVGPLLTLNAAGSWQVQMASAHVLSSTLDVRCVNNHTDEQMKQHLLAKTGGA